MLPEGHPTRAPLDERHDLPEYLSEHLEEFKTISAHRGAGFSGAEPIIETLEKYDSLMRIEREPHEIDILLTLDLVARAEAAKPSNTENRTPPKRGNRR